MRISSARQFNDLLEKEIEALMDSGMSEEEAEDEAEVIRKRAEPFRDYFGIMRISDEAKERRIDFAEEFKEFLLFVFTLIEVARQNNAVNREALRNTIDEGYINILTSRTEVDTYLELYAGGFADDFIDSTMKHIDDPWFLSEDRAEYVAENEANTSENYIDFKEAYEAGYRSKTWHTQNDRRVRKTHVGLEGKTIPIDSYFTVGNALMRFPKDTDAWDYPEEIINCRCSVTYSKKGEPRKMDNETP